MKITIYDKNTGELRRTFEGPQDLVSLQLSEDEAYVEGFLPLRSTKIDTGTLEPVHFEPPSPSPDHVWDEGRQLHRLNADGLRKAQAQIDIQLLEAKQMRALRELALGDKEAAARLQSIDDQIKVKRKEL